MMQHDPEPGLNQSASTARGQSAGDTNLDSKRLSQRSRLAESYVQFVTTRTALCFIESQRKKALEKSAQRGQDTEALIESLLGEDEAYAAYRQALIDEISEHPENAKSHARTPGHFVVDAVLEGLGIENFSAQHRLMLQADINAAAEGLQTTEDLDVYNILQSLAEADGAEVVTLELYCRALRAEYRSKDQYLKRFEQEFALSLENIRRIEEVVLEGLPSLMQGTIRIDGTTFDSEEDNLHLAPPEILSNLQTISREFFRPAIKQYFSDYREAVRCCRDMQAPLKDYFARMAFPES